eukprot:1157969-Pelagomonas_calceolata.AAC.16
MAGPTSGVQVGIVLPERKTAGLHHETNVSGLILALAFSYPPAAALQRTREGKENNTAAVGKQPYF